MASDHLATGLHPFDAVFAEALTRIREELDALEDVVNDHRLDDVELEMSTRPRNTNRNVVAHHVRRHHRERLGLRRIHLAWHDGAAWLVRRENELAQARTWAAREETHVVA